MKRFVCGLGLIGVLAVAQPAMAQEKGFFRAMVGATVGTETGAAFGGTVGFKVTTKGMIFGEIGGLSNVLPKEVTTQVDVAAAKVANAEGGKSSSSSSASAVYGLFGTRINTRDVSRAHTFVEIGVGVAHVKSSVEAVIRGSATLQGDISNQVVTGFTSGTPETKPCYALGFGLNLGVTKSTAIEMGYRFIQIFTEDVSAKTSKIYGAFKFGF
jgi:opacity protein-like surface antigen